MQWLLRQINKWSAIAVGIFFLMWTVSGIVMLLPAHMPTPRGPDVAGPASGLFGRDYLASWGDHAS